VSARTDPEGAAERVETTPHALTWPDRVWRVIKETTGTCMRYRVMGLAAEAAFFGVLSLPPLIFGLAVRVGLSRAPWISVPSQGFASSCSNCPAAS
jgi:hypothetical protein